MAGSVRWDFWNEADDREHEEDGTDEVDVNSREVSEDIEEVLDEQESLISYVFW